MNLPRCFRLALVALAPMAAIGIGSVLAQSPPPAAPPAASEPSTPTPAPSPSPTPAPMASPSPAPVPPPATAETPPAPPAAAAPVQTADPFGEEITLTPKTVIMLKGKADWDSAFDTLIDSFKTLSGLLEKQGITPSGNAMIVYTATDDTGFSYLTEIPVDQEPKNLVRDR